MDTPKKGQLWTGWILTGLISALMLMAGTMGIMHSPDAVKAFTMQYGYPAEVMVPLGITQICCGILFLIPRTTVLGAVLLTAYLGGAVATHVRVHESFIPPVVFGILVWLAVYLRDPRVRALLPLRASS
jgi:uncharacterized membrane protein YphA (DoxX/SURF4 family)